MIGTVVAVIICCGKFMEPPFIESPDGIERQPQVQRKSLFRLQNIKQTHPILLALCAFSLTVIVSVGALAVTRNVLAVPDVKLSTLDEARAGLSIYDRFDRFICTVHEKRDTEPVPLSKVSMNMRNAILAIEDHKFYEHKGIDPTSIARALYNNWKAGRIVEGASTLTQQLAKNLFLDKNDRSYKRKLSEAFLAYDLESRYSKNKILESYLNEVYYGNGVHGIERAASHYFNKHASHLSLSESAFLAGLVQSPTSMGLPENRSKALARRDEVLNKMAEYKFVAAEDSNAAKHVKLTFKRGPHRLHYPHYVTYAVDQAEAELGDDAWKRGYKVYTHLDPAAQQKAVQSLTQGIKSAPRGIDQAALVSISLKDGGIVSMVGGVGTYEANQWNRATHPHTAGSTFKPFVYLSALMQGVIQQDTLIEDSEIKQNEEKSNYCPKNFDGRYRGWMTARDALVQSRNVCAVRVANQAGISNVIETAHAAGIKSQIDQYPSTALGASAASPLEMAVAYGTLARGGVYMPATALRKIETTDGKLVKTFESRGSANLPAESVAQLVDVLQDVVRRGTGTQAQLAGIPVAGKTGTADKGRDIWFVGFTPDVVTAVWGGNDQHKAVPGMHVTGGEVMARMWRNYMSAYYANHKAEKLAFAPPAVPLIRQIPIFEETDLATGMNYTAMLEAHVVPVSSSYRLPESAYAHVVSGSGLASAVELQRVEANYRNQVAQLQPGMDGYSSTNQFGASEQNVQTVLANSYVRTQYAPAAQTTSFAQKSDEMNYNAATVPSTTSRISVETRTEAGDTSTDNAGGHVNPDGMQSASVIQQVRHSERVY